MKDIESGKIQLPSIQRDWSWNDEKIRELIASVISGYPVGSVLFLECEGEPPFKSNPVVSVSLTGKIFPKNLILDGQQRLTAIYCAMYNVGQPVKISKKNSVDERYYYLDIEKVAGKNFDSIEAIISVPKDKKIKKNAKNNNPGLDLSTPEKEFESKMFPLNIIFDTKLRNKWGNEYRKFYQANRPNSYSQVENELEEFQMICSSLESYTIPVISLDADTKIEAVCNIFEKVNSSNQPLTGFDLLKAIFEKEDFDLRSDWDKRKEKIFSKGILEGFEPKNFLRACKLFANYKNGAYDIKKNVIIDLKCSDYKSCADTVSSGFVEAEKLLDEEGIVGKNSLPYSSQLIPLAVICALLSEANNSVTDGADIIKQKIKQWYWCGVFSKFYENAANDSKFHSNIRDVMNWINGNDTPELVRNFEVDAVKLKEITSGALFKGIIALIIKNGCKDFTSGRTVKNIYGDPDVAVEIHHIFPKDSYQKRYGDLLESVLNKTPVSKKTNSIIGGISPSNYLTKLMSGPESEITTKKNSKKNKQKKFAADFVSRENLEIYLSSHWINIKSLEEDNFEDFLADRAIQILKAVCNVTGKKFMDVTFD